MLNKILQILTDVSYYHTSARDLFEKKMKTKPALTLRFFFFCTPRQLVLTPQQARAIEEFVDPVETCNNNNIFISLNKS